MALHRIGAANDAMQSAVAAVVVAAVAVMHTIYFNSFKYLAHISCAQLNLQS